MSARPTNTATVELTGMLGEGPARCDYCYGRYSFELEVICVTCDRPMCPLCAVRARLRHSCCPECIPAIPGEGSEE